MPTSPSDKESLKESHDIFVQDEMQDGQLIFYGSFNEQQLIGKVFKQYGCLFRVIEKEGIFNYGNKLKFKYKLWQLR